jgi:hypothetical protein
MDPTSRPVTVEIGGRDVTLHFNFATYKKFEQLTNKFFMNWFGELQNASFKLIKEVRQTRNSNTLGKRNEQGELIDESGNVLTPEEAFEQVFLKTDIDLLGILRHTSMTDFSAFVYAAAHEIDGNGRRVWPISQDELDLALDIPTFQKLLPIILNAASDNGPRRKAEEVTEPARPTSISPATNAKRGGSQPGESADVILDSLPRRRRA